MVQGSPSPIEGGGDNFLLLQEIFIPPVSSACKAQPRGRGWGAFSWFVGGVPAMKWLHNNTGRGHSLASAVTSPGKKVAEDISKTRMIPKGTEALSPAL